MILKRNLFTILYSVLFVGFMGAGFAIMAGLLLTNDTESYLNACIFALCLLIYLIAAFFLKEKGVMLAAEGKDSLYIILETVLVLASVGGIIFLDLSKGADKLVWIVLMLICTYAASRLLGGRLCGIFGLLLSFFYLVSVTGYTVIEQEYLDSLCFLVPFVLFLLIVQILIPRFLDNGFILISSYILLSVVFTFAIIMNPFTAVLFIGCVLALIFGETKKRMSLSGTILAGIFFAVTLLFLVAAWLFLGDLMILPEWIPDETLFSSASLGDLGMYILDKYTSGMAELSEPFELGIFPAFFTFMGTAAGYYAIRRKTSAVGPFCLSFVFLFIVYILYGETENHFYYMQFFLPVFAAYAFACTLLPENWNVAFHGSEEEKEEEEEEASDDVELTNLDTEETVYELELEEEEKTEDVLAHEPLLKPVKELEEAGQDVQKEEESVDRPIEDIPEWKVSEVFLQSNQPEKMENSEPEEISKEEVEPVRIPETEPVQAEEAQELLRPVEQPEPQQEVMLEAGVLSEQETENLTVPNYAEEDSGSIDENVISDNKDDLLSSYTEDDNMIPVSLPVEEEQDAEEDESKLNDLLNRLDISDNIRRMNESAQEDRADVIERDDEKIELASAIPTDDFGGLTNVAEDNNLTDISGLPGNIGQELSPETEFELEPELLSESGVEIKNEETDSEEDLNMLDLDSFTPSENISDSIFEEKIPEPQNIMPPETNEPVISEYGKVPTINDLERKWRSLSGQDSSHEMENGFAYSLEDIPGAKVLSDFVRLEENRPSEVEEYTAVGELPEIEKQLELEEMPEPEDLPTKVETDAEALVSSVSLVVEEKPVPSMREIHSEQIVKKSGKGKRSYHKITWRR